jgi:hypothetical protein
VVVGSVTNGSSPCSGARANFLSRSRSSSLIWQSAKLWLSRMSGTTGKPAATAATTIGGQVAHC